MTTKVANDMLETPGITRGTAITTNGASSYEFTDVPASARKITLMLRNVSVTGAVSGWFRLQVGTSGGYITSGYTSTVGALANGVTPTAGFDNIGFMPAFGVADAELYSGLIELAEIEANVWVMSSNLKASTTRMCFSSGDVSAGAEVTSLKLSINSSGTFDGGTINVLYE